MADRAFPGLTLVRSLALPPEVDNDVWHTWPPEHSLPLDASAYTVDQRDGGWAVLSNVDGTVVHSSSEPIELVACPVPF